MRRFMGWVGSFFLMFAVMFAVGASAVAEPTAGATKSFFVSECLTKRSLCSTVQLVRYLFEDGKLASRESLRQFSVEDVRFGLGQNHWVEDRYVITQWGDVVDVEENRLLHDGRGKLLGVEDGLVVLKINKVDLEGFFAYHLDRQTYERLDAPGKWALPGQRSPNGRRSVEVSLEGVARLHALDGEATELHSDLTVQLSPKASSFSQAPIFWLDDETLLTQEANGQLILLGTDFGVRPLVEIPSETLPLSLPTLSRGAEGEILYRLAGQTYRIHVEERRYDRVTWLPLGHGFEIEPHAKQRAKPGSARQIRYQGKVIGSYCCRFASAKTAPGHLALEFGPVGSSPGHSTSLVVWSDASEAWTQLEIKFIEASLGWTSW